jgi:hypothetical protein
MNEVYQNTRSIADFKKESDTKTLRFFPLTVGGEVIYYRNADGTPRLFGEKPVQKLKVKHPVTGKFIADVSYAIACDWYGRKDNNWPTGEVVVSDRMYDKDGELLIVPQVHYAINVGEDSGL